MAFRSTREVLAPNNPQGFHQRKGERIENKSVEIGKAKFQNFITDSTLVECDLLIHCGANAVNLFGSTFDRCAFRPRREMSNLRMTGITLKSCSFHGKYSGCRFGNEEDDDRGEVVQCDFSQSALFHLCDFLDGSAIETFRWPAWPHIVITDLARSAKSWARLKLPEELQLVQESIAGGPPARAVTIHLPFLTDHFEELRELLARQSYIVLS